MFSRPERASEKALRRAALLWRWHDYRISFVEDIFQFGQSENGRLQNWLGKYLVQPNMEYKYGEWKHMFHKGNKSATPNKAPGVFLHDTQNSIRVYMNTLQNINEYVDIENIPLKRWVHMAIVLKGKYLDIYVNGYLRKRHELSSVVKQNFGDLWLNLFGGFEGYMCRMRYYRRALEFTEVENIVRSGPSNSACGDTGDKPPYLDDNWWYDF